MRKKRRVIPASQPSPRDDSIQFIKRGIALLETSPGGKETQTYRRLVRRLTELEETE